VTSSGIRSTVSYAVLLAAICIVLAAASNITGCVPSNWSLKRMFPAYRTAAERLVTMLLEDPNVVIVRKGSIALSSPETFLFEEYPDRVPQELWPITPARWKEYRDLLEEIDLPMGATRCGPSTIAVPVYLRGFLLHGNEAGYVYSEDRFQSTEQCPKFHVEHIEGPWYAYNRGL
jgi:hypothetical protein